MKRFFLTLPALLFLLSGCGDGITVKIDPDDYSDTFAAMWFNPSTGETASVTSLQTPPSQDYEIFIHPADPELVMRPCGASTCGFTQLGHGADIFYANEIPTTQSAKFKSRLKWTADNTVFLIQGRGTNSRSLMMILSMNKRSEEIAFKWKKLPNGI